MKPLFIILATLILAPFAQDNTANEIHVTVIGTDGRLQPAVFVEFVSEDESVEESCITGTAKSEMAGQCTIENIPAPADGGMIRGRLQVGSFGYRSVTWPGGELILLVDVSPESDDLSWFHPPHEHDATATPEPTTAPTPIPEATPEAETEPEAQPETETAFSTIELISPQETATEAPPIRTSEPLIKHRPSTFILILTTVCITLIVVGMVGLIIYLVRKRGG